LGVSGQTVTSWLKKVATFPPLETTLEPYEAGDVLELDEVWSFVKRRKNKRWLCVAEQGQSWLLWWAVAVKEPVEDSGRPFPPNTNSLIVSRMFGKRMPKSSR
jgi:hypothetical protein